MTRDLHVYYMVSIFIFVPGVYNVWTRYAYLYHSVWADEKYRHSIYPPYTLAVSFDLVWLPSNA